MHHQHGGLAQLLQGYYVPNSLQLERGEPLARDSRFSPKFTQRNRQGFLSRLPSPPAPVPRN